MADSLRLMCIMAHPDDESMGTGSTLAKYAAEGVEIGLVCATRGQKGWNGAPEAYPGPEGLGRIREVELRAAAEILSIRYLRILDFMDGELDTVPPDQALPPIVQAIREFRPQVVITFGQDGAYGHPDHVAISQYTIAAIAQAAVTTNGALPPHTVSKLYFMAVDKMLADVWTALFGDIGIKVDGIFRQGLIWPDWSITAVIEGYGHWKTAWEAVACHRSQIPNLDELKNAPEEALRTLWGYQPYYRAFSLVNHGRKKETDLFEGLR